MDITLYHSIWIKVWTFPNKFQESNNHSFYWVISIKTGEFDMLTVQIEWGFLFYLTSNRSGARRKFISYAFECQKYNELKRTNDSITFFPDHTYKDRVISNLERSGSVRWPTLFVVVYSNFQTKFVEWGHKIYSIQHICNKREFQTDKMISQNKRTKVHYRNVYTFIFIQ